MVAMVRFVVMSNMSLMDESNSEVTAEALHSARKGKRDQEPQQRQHRALHPADADFRAFRIVSPAANSNAAADLRAHQHPHKKTQRENGKQERVNHGRYGSPAEFMVLSGRTIAP